MSIQLLVESYALLFFLMHSICSFLFQCTSVSKICILDFQLEVYHTMCGVICQGLASFSRNLINTSLYNRQPFTLLCSYHRSEFSTVPVCHQCGIPAMLMRECERSHCELRSAVFNLTILDSTLNCFTPQGAVNIMRARW